MIRLFKHYIPVSLLILGVAEILVLGSSIYIGMLTMPLVEPETEYATAPSLVQIFLFFLVMITAMTAMGLYQRRYQDDIRDLLFRIGLSFASGLVVLGALFYAIPTTFPGSKALAISVSVAFLGILLARTLFVHMADKSMLRRRVLILGAGESAHMIEKLRRRSDNQGFVIVGYVHIAGEHNAIAEEKLIDNRTPLAKLAEQYCVDEVVVAVKDRRKTLPVHDLLDCKMSGVSVLTLAAFFERQLGRVRLDVIEPSWMIFSDGFRQNFFIRTSKRIFDLTVSALLLLLTWPVMLLTAIFILLESFGKGSVLYRQARVGEQGRIFNVLKFRSMFEDAEKDGAPQWAKVNDNRITRVGNFIRKTRIDELPQLFNVLKGDMSFVGPRPERPHFVEQLKQNIPFYSERHRVKPGITGWAQICYPYGSSEDDARAKLEYDLYYVKNYSLFLDFTILFQTAEVILWGKGAR